MEIKEKLNSLDIGELKILAKKIGIKFTDGIDSVKDNINATAKEQIILVLDETDKRELLREIQRLLN